MHYLGDFFMSLVLPIAIPAWILIHAWINKAHCDGLNSTSSSNPSHKPQIKASNTLHMHINLDLDLSSQIHDLPYGRLLQAVR
jgi:hypothetical protein